MPDNNYVRVVFLESKTVVLNSVVGKTVESVLAGLSNMKDFPKEGDRLVKINDQQVSEDFVLSGGKS